MRTLDTTAEPTADWDTRLTGTVTDRHDAGTEVTRDLDARHPDAFDAALRAEGIDVVHKRRSPTPSA
ncbi:MULTISPECIES: hypothetical protein [unclassified Streptomyces]|uniref:hypothetical protein n=1 Tax=unclassified Streptomyces TaxID=2593676 RepID=UPI0033D7E82A